MTKQIILLGFFYLLMQSAFSQTGSIINKDTAGIFEKMAAEMKHFRPDTTAPPNDRITQKIIELRSLRGGFNIDEALAYKLAEERQKNEIPKAEMDKFANFMTTGDGKRWLHHSIIWIYRQHFTYKELKQLVKFYKTDAGKKMAAGFPIIMLQSMQSAEQIKEWYGQQQKSK